MNGIFFGIVAAVLMLSSVAFGQALQTYGDYSAETGKLTFQVFKGWNVIPLIDMGRRDGYTNTCGYSNDKDFSIKAAYYFSPLKEKYYGVTVKDGKTTNTPPESNDVFTGEKNLAYYHAMYGGWWMYSSKNCRIETKLDTQTDSQVNFKARNPTIKKGWNFFTIQPFMVGKNMKEMLANCNVAKGNYWNPSKGQRGGGTNDQGWHYDDDFVVRSVPTSASPIPANAVGATYLLKFGSDCRLNIADDDTPAAPPTLP